MRASGVVVVWAASGPVRCERWALLPEAQRHGSPCCDGEQGWSLVPRGGRGLGGAARERASRRRGRRPLGAASLPRPRPAGRGRRSGAAAAAAGQRWRALPMAGCPVSLGRLDGCARDVRRVGAGRGEAGRVGLRGVPMCGGVWSSAMRWSGGAGPLWAVTGRARRSRAKRSPSGSGMLPPPSVSLDAWSGAREGIVGLARCAGGRFRRCGSTPPVVAVLPRGIDAAPRRAPTRRWRPLLMLAAATPQIVSLSPRSRSRMAGCCPSPDRSRVLALRGFAFAEKPLRCGMMRVSRHVSDPLEGASPRWMVAVLVM